MVKFDCRDVEFRRLDASWYRVLRQLLKLIAPVFAALLEVIRELVIPIEASGAGLL